MTITQATPAKQAALKAVLKAKRAALKAAQKARKAKRAAAGRRVRKTPYDIQRVKLAAFNAEKERIAEQERIAEKERIVAVQIAKDTRVAKANRRAVQEQWRIGERFKEQTAQAHSAIMVNWRHFDVINGLSK